MISSKGAAFPLPDEDVPGPKNVVFDPAVDYLPDYYPPQPDEESTLRDELLIAELLVRHGAELNTSKGGFCPLALLIDSGQHLLFSGILEFAHTYRRSINSTTRDLLMSRSLDNDNFVQSLLAHGVDANGGYRGKSFLCTAVTKPGNEAVVSRLLKFGARVFPSPRSDLSAETCKLIKALSATFSAVQKQADTIRNRSRAATLVPPVKTFAKLLSDSHRKSFSNADFEVVDATDINDPMAVGRLYSLGALDSVRDNMALLQAASSGNHSILPLLIQAAADQKFPLDFALPLIGVPLTPLLSSIMHRHTKCIELLLKAGANPNPPNASLICVAVKTVLHLAYQVITYSLCCRVASNLLSYCWMQVYHLTKISLAT